MEFNLEDRNATDINLAELGYNKESKFGFISIKGSAEEDLKSKEEFENKILDIKNYESLTKNISIENERDFMIPVNVDLEIFDDTLLDDAELLINVSEGSESSSSSDEQLQTTTDWFQMQPFQDIHQKLYGFDRKCRESMVSMEEYLLTCIVKPDIVKIVTKIGEANKLILYLSHITRHFKQYKNQSTLKSVFKAIIWGLKDFLKETKQPVFIGKQKAISLNGKRLTFLRCKAFSDKEEAMRIAASSTQVRFVNEMTNSRSETNWVTQELQQLDFDRYIMMNELKDPFTSTGSFMDILNTIFPTMHEYQDEYFDGNYAF